MASNSSSEANTAKVFNNVTYESAYNMTEAELEAYLAELSDQMTLILLPVLLVLGLILLLGALGNSLVFYIYFTRFPACSTRSAILTLAVLDFATCAVGIPGEIIDLRYAFNFSNDFQCRSIRTVTTVTMVASGLTLLAVAHDRFQRICRPLKEQLSARRAWHRVTVCVLLAILISVPAPVIFGLSKVPTARPDVYGTECSNNQKFKDHPLPIIYNIIQSLVFLSACSAMIVLYVFVGRQIFRQAHFRSSVQQTRRHSVVRMKLADNGLEQPRRLTISQADEKEIGKQPVDDLPLADVSSSFSDQKASASDVRENGTNANVRKISNGKASREKRDGSMCVQNGWNREELDCSSSTSARKENYPDIKENSGVEPDLPSNFSAWSKHSKSLPRSPTDNQLPSLKRRKSFLSRIRRQSGNAEAARTRKTTTMLAFITAAFIISFLPHLILKALQATDETFTTSLSGAGFVLYNIFVRSYFFSTATNFFIYGFCSPRFRIECSRLLVKITKCGRGRRRSLQSDLV